jgi:hypothetical protein
MKGSLNYSCFRSPQCHKDSKVGKWIVAFIDMVFIQNLSNISKFISSSLLISNGQEDGQIDAQD